MTSLPLLCSLLLGQLATESQTDTELLLAAESAFAEGNSGKSVAAQHSFARAAGFSDQLWQRGIHNAPLARNQGNAALLAGDLPQAILAYRRGLRLVPNDRTLHANLALARSQVSYPESTAFGRPPIDDWPPWLPAVSPWMLMLGAWSCFVLACCALTRWLMIRQYSWLGCATIAGMATLPAVIARTFPSGPAQQLAVVRVDGVTVYKGNGRSYPCYPHQLNRGVEAHALTTRGNWVQIELATGEVGWIERGQLLLDEAAELSRAAQPVRQDWAAVRAASTSADGLGRSVGS